jgi:hypothetical protein
MEWVGFAGGRRREIGVRKDGVGVVRWNGALNWGKEASVAGNDTASEGGEDPPPDLEGGQEECPAGSSPLKPGSD